MITKHDVEKMIVVRPGTAVPSAGDRLFNPSTGVLNLPIGGAGVYADVPGSSNPVAIDGTTNVALLNTTPGIDRPFRIIQRRDTSNDPANLLERTLEQSQYISNTCTLGIEWGGEAFDQGSVNTWLLGGASSGVNAFTVDSDTTYKIEVAADGYRTDMINSVYNTPTVTGRFESPTWTNTTYTTAENQRDYTVKALVADFNRQASRGMQRLALAVALDPGDGAATTAGPTVASIIAGGAGATVTIGYDKGCQPVNLLITEERLEAFVALEAHAVLASGSGGLGLLAGDLRVAPYALPTDCTTGAVTEIAGDGNSAAQYVFIIAIDAQTVAYDELPQTKRRLRVGYSLDGFAGNLGTEMITAADEGAGQARNLRIMYDNVEHYKSYSSSRRWGAMHVSYPDEILNNEVYDVYGITHCYNRSATSGMPAVSTLYTLIALVHTERAAPTSPFSTGAINPQKTYFEGALNAIFNAYSPALQSVNL